MIHKINQLYKAGIINADKTAHKIKAIDEKAPDSSLSSRTFAVPKA